jgi:hypothetical protein
VGRYDPTCLYVSQDAVLVAFGCGERHPLPVVLAPCSAGSSCNLCDELVEAFTDNSSAGRKVLHARLAANAPNPKPNVHSRLDSNVLAEHAPPPRQPQRYKTVGRSRWSCHRQNGKVRCWHCGGAAGWQRFDFHNRNSRNAFAAFMHDRCTYTPWSAYSLWSGARSSPCSSTAISRQAVEVFIDMPRPQASASTWIVMTD